MPYDLIDESEKKEDYCPEGGTNIHEKEGKGMGKKIFLLLLGLFVLVAAGCATTSSTSSLTASEANKALLGKWSGAWETDGCHHAAAFDSSMVIKRANLDQRIMEINFSWSRMTVAGEEDVRAEYISPDKFKFSTKDNIHFEYQLKDGILWGWSTSVPKVPGPCSKGYPGKIKMTKIKE